MCKRIKTDIFSKRILMIPVLLLLTIIVVGSSVSGMAKSKRAEKNFYKYYTSVAVGKGDTLWSIASENMTPGYNRIEEYIQEIRSLNHLYDDGIYAGEYLTIPRYFEESLDYTALE